MQQLYDAEESLVALERSLELAPDFAAAQELRATLLTSLGSDNDFLQHTFLGKTLMR